MIDRALRIARARAHRHLPDLPQRRAGEEAVEDAAARDQDQPDERRLQRAARRPARRRPAPRRRRAQRRRAGGDAGRRRRARRRGRGDRRRRALGAGVAKALLGKDALPDDLPFVTGAIGLLGTKPSLGPDAGVRHAADGRHGFPYSEFLPEWDQARAVQIDRDPTMIGLRYPDGGEPRRRRRRDAARAAAAAAAEGRPRLARRGRAERARLVGADGSADPRSPPTRSIRSCVFWELSQRLPDDAILTADSGTVANWYARDVRLRRACAARCRGASPPWARRCPTPWRPSSPIPIGR